MNIVYTKVPAPKAGEYKTPVDLNRQTMEEHLKKVLQAVQDQNLDVLMIYADREHGTNFAYLTGFEPRFEEAVLVLNRDGKCFLLLGNENLKMAQYSFVPAEVIHVPHFSLPYQPMETDKTLDQLIASAGIHDGMNIGLCGWKLFTGHLEDNDSLFDIPSFIVDAVRKNNPNGQLKNACSIFLNAKNGLRNHKNANEIAHYEFNAGLASSRVLVAMNAIETGKTEMEIAGCLTAGGQPTSVTTICATGERFTNAVVFPRAKAIQKGDRFSVTLGLRGGLSSRAAYVAQEESDLPAEVRDYIPKVVIPYYRAIATWLGMMKIGTPCSEIYAGIEEVLPKKDYHWSLNPGHYTDADEWSASPVFPGSEVQISSGMMFQIDIIPSVPGYGGVSAEDGIAIADESLREELKTQYPETWERISRRRAYMNECLGISLPDEVLPMSDICGYLRPLLLKKDCAVRCE